MQSPDNVESEADIYWGNLERHLLDTLNQAVSKETRVLLLDYPVYSNIGDLLIYLGTIRWAACQNLHILGRWHIGNYHFGEIDKDVVILCQGGGNFGDLYGHQVFRERVVATYPDNKIIFLPQTIHYISSDRLNYSADILNRHSDLHIFLRDKVSLSVAKEKFTNCSSYLAPDMATLLYPLNENLNASIYPSESAGTLCLMREDIEKLDDNNCGEDNCTWKGDWNDILGWRKYIFYLFQNSAGVLKYISPDQAYSYLYSKYTTSVVKHCIRFFSKYENVVTSRLHGHILASLMNKPNVVLDNIYGKNSSYFDVWHTGMPNTQLRK